MYSLLDSTQLTQQQQDLLKKYPYAIERSYKNVRDNSGKVRRVLYKSYYLGGFKTQDGAMKNQKIADEIATILNNKPSKALLREVK